MDFPISGLGGVTEAMQTYPEMMPHDKRALVITDTFLGGFAPRLRTLWLDFIPLRVLRTLLLSARRCSPL